MDRQDIFNRVVAHLRKQGGPAYNRKTRKCRYRTPDGCACAIGALIPDDRYDPKLEGKGVLSNDVLQAAGFYPETTTGSDVGFLHKLQSKLHDIPAFETGSDEEWFKAFEEAVPLVAAFHGLEVPA